MSTQTRWADALRTTQRDSVALTGFEAEGLGAGLVNIINFICGKQEPTKMEKRIADVIGKAMGKTSTDQDKLQALEAENTRLKLMLAESMPCNTSPQKERSTASDDIHYLPTQLARTRFLQATAEVHGIALSLESAQAIIQYARGDTRALQGLLFKVHAVATFHGKPITPSLIEDELRALGRETDQEQEA